MSRAVVISGGCGGSSSETIANLNNNDNDDNDQESYTNEITKKLMAESTVYSLTDFLADKSFTVRKGDVLLYILDDNHSIGIISKDTEHLTREVESSSASAGDASATFSGVTASFNFALNKEPREYYFTKRNGMFNLTYRLTYKAWHRETSMAFNIVPVHSFNDNSDYYVIQVTGNTDPSK